MKHSESIIKIVPALLAAQRKMGGAKKGAVNPYFHSKYADLGAVMEACKDALNDNDITILQPVGTDEFGVYVETVLLHISGEWISDKMRISQKEENNPQAQGSAISYARRYSLQSMVFIPAEDDDANSASLPKKSIVEQPSKSEVVSQIPITNTQKTRVMVLLGEKKKTMDNLTNAIKVGFKKTLLKELTSHEADTLIAKLESIEE